MNVRNFLAPGDFVITVPVGLNITLQYDEKGNIQKLLMGLDPSGVELPEELLNEVLLAGIVPRTIPIVQGTTWISGIFTRSGILSTKSGKIPDDIIEDISVDLLENPCEFTFYAASVESNSMKFTGGLSSQKWLQSTGFEILPNYVIPATLTDSQWAKMIASVDFVIAGLLVMHQWKWTYVSFELQQHTVASVSKQFDDAGYLNGIISFTSGDRLSVDYINIVNYNVQPNSVVVHDSMDLVKIYPATDKVREPRSARVECPVCGSVISVIAEMTPCSNPYCPSNFYQHTQHFLSVLGLPILSRNRYMEAFKGVHELKFTDVLKLPEYVNQKISATPYQLIRAAVPLTIVRADRAIEELCSRCNNTIQSIQYYIRHIDTADVGIGLSLNSKHALMPLAEHSLLLDVIDSMFHHPNVAIQIVNVKFDGPQIFRGSKIGITGTFRHGSHSEMKAILRSYGADVVVDSADVGCLITGDILEEFNGQVIRDAKYNHIPVFTETEFFNRYEIDEDLQLQQGGLV